MNQHIGAPASPVVAKGDQVYVGTVVGKAGGFVSSDIHSGVSGTVAEISTMVGSNGSTQTGSMLIRATGIALIAEFGCQLCKDAGESALASKVELAGKISILVLSLPLFEDIAQTALGLIGG